jgi:hypothetical protein
MPLSEHEQRLLDEIEQALYAEDPKFVSSVRSARRRRTGGRRTSVLVSLLCVGVGLALVLVGLLATVIALSVVGFVLLVGGFVYGIQAVRHAAAPTTTGKSAPRPQRQGGVRGRMEDRLRKRFDES